MRTKTKVIIPIVITYIYIYPFSVISSLICNHKIFLKGRYLYFVANILH